MDLSQEINRIFPDLPKILASFRERPGDEPKRADNSTRKQLDTKGTSGSQPGGTPGKAPHRNEHWTREHDLRRRVRLQAEAMGRAELSTEDIENSFQLNKIQSRLNACGQWHIVRQYGADEWEAVGGWHCKLKCCPRCQKKRAGLLASRYLAWLESMEASKLLEDYDLGLFTVTLRHGEGSRKGWYHKELQTHFRNSLKYGDFNAIIKGGAYQDEVTLTANGFHIHRHCLVLVPKEMGLATSGNYVKAGKGWRWKPENTILRDRLKKAWEARTGDSFQVDLRPLNPNQDIKRALSEVFKYLAKPDKKTRLIAPEIALEFAKHPEARFYGRFGILYKIAALKINLDRIDEPEDNSLGQVEERLHMAKGLYKKRSGLWSFREVHAIPNVDGKADWKKVHQRINLFTRENLLARQERSYQRRTQRRRRWN